ncbi:MAG: peptide deformylase [Candidatus Cloacimonetes bacterium]|nr:peptide deformylase [Candidatus Cloacimonadota bacterium]MCF7814994.1 peptide deformylase [Candidatus Cloacimonadota bacterium]MCF7868410.1 peptide deformylase [Candidatus Cloacimonadota bacterium]MCF7883883.1 peptide deformylase [Candidatus Cloacimonadota bacterium]
MKNNEPEILPIRIYGDKILRQKAEPIDKMTPEVKEFLEDLTYTMYETDGVGLAAPQVGVSKRIFVVDAFWFKEGGKKDPVIFINPEFTEFEGVAEAEEGCLSLPDIYEKVTRAAKVRIRGLNPDGEMVSYEAEGLFARALQHEFDHLDGVLFVDKINKLKKIMIKKKLKDLASTTSKNGVNIGKQMHHTHKEL